MTEHDYDAGYRAGMQKMRDLALDASIDELEAANDAAEKSNRICIGNLWRFWPDKVRQCGMVFAASPH